MVRLLVIVFSLLILFSCSVNNTENTDSYYNKSVSGETEMAIQSAVKSVKNIRIISTERRVLLDDIAHYTMVLQVGNGEFDKIAIHRVVREKKPGVAIRNTKGVMTLNGSPSNFIMDYLPSTATTSIPSDQSIAIYLAQNNIDVWGVDMRYALLPLDITDFSIMKDWGVSMELKDIELAVAVARTVRSLTGLGNDKMILTGISFGAFECYAMANAETQKPNFLRNISAIMPVEITFKFDLQYGNLKNAAYARYQDAVIQINNGIYANTEGAAIILVSSLSQSAPDEQSQIIPGFTNRQAFLFLLTSSYAATTPPLEPYVPFYHYLTGDFDENFMPVGLKYTNENTIYDLSLIMPPYCSNAAYRDFEAVMSDSVDTPFDDHLNDVKVPVFYIGSAGGFGKYGLYTIGLLGSMDTKSLIIQDYPDEYAALDYGHADLMWAPNAKELIWKPMLEWINIH